MVLAAVPDATWVDLVSLVLLVLFVAWGSVHGAVRQGLGLLVLLAGFPVASAFASRIDGQMAKVVTLGPAGRACACWLLLWAGTVVLGAILLHLLRHLLDRVPHASRANRAAGGALGLVKGVVVMALGVYALLGWFVPDAGPSIVRAIRESRVAGAAAGLADHLRPALRLPAGVASRVEAVNAGIRAGRAS